MATVNLGSIKFNWQGAYNGATAYAVDDVVSSGGNSYVCIAATTGNTPPNATYWELMAQAGTNGTDGTDLGTTLTTQGDLVYYNGSALARLGAGTSGQVLQTNGTGANPSWGTVSSDFVKIHEVTMNGTDAAVTFDNYFSSTYDHYKIIVDHAAPATDTYDGYYLRLLDASGSVITSSSYRSGFLYNYMNASTNSSGNVREWGVAQFRLHTDHIGLYTDRYKPFWMEMDMKDPLDAGSSTRVYWRCNADDGSGDSEYVTIGSGYYDSQLVHRGFQFLSRDGDAIASQCTIKLYGIK